MDLKNKKIVVADAEFDSLNPTRVWCVCTKEYPTEIKRTFRFDIEKDFEDLRQYAQEVDIWVGHNFLSFDSKHLKRLEKVNVKSVLDTLIISRLIWPQRPGGHSIENLGKKFSLDKKEIIEYNNHRLIDEYVERCLSDVDINYSVFLDLLRFIEDPEWDEAINLEHETHLICQDIHENGFSFDTERASVLLDEISTRLKKLTDEIRESVGPVREYDKTVTFRRNKDGQPSSRSVGYIKEGYFSVNSKDGDKYDVLVSRPFNPGSPKDRVNLLNDSGWRPYIKTDTHRKAAQELANKRRNGVPVSDKEQERLDRLSVTGWKVCEENLETLPEDAPEGAKKLAEWLTLEGRRADLVEWLGAVRASDGRIHPKLFHIGGWTQRASHSNPNCANIFSVFHGEANSPVKQIKQRYDHILRSLWKASDGRVLVGTDADGIQLRVLAHLMGDQDYINAVADGRKEDESDVHNVNKRALSLSHLTRDHAKTFIYAWLLGASTPKIAQILECTFKEARVAEEAFLESVPALKRLRKELIPMYAKQGWFPGLDGRKVICDSEHLMLAGLLQNGEKVIMAKANVIWRNRCKFLGVPFWQVNWVHDEWQTEAPPEVAELVGELQRDALTQAGQELNLSIPIVGETKIGNNWLETH